MLQGLNAVFHWLDAGWKEGEDPNPLFDSDWYLAQNPDVAEAAVVGEPHALHGEIPVAYISLAEGKPKDAQGRAYAAAMKRMQEERAAKKKGPPKRFKRRK